MLRNQFQVGLLWMLGFLFLGFQSFAQPNAAEGKELFKANCASCHAGNMKTDLTGPALAGTEERWAEYPREDLYTWIRASQKLISEGHPRATELWAKWTPTVMNNFPNLTDDNIESLLLYINEKANEQPEVAGTPGGGETGGGASGGNNTTFYISLLVILGILALILGRIVTNLNRLADEKDGKILGRRSTLVEQLLSPKVIGFALFALVLVGGYTTVNNAIDLGRQQDYAPTQPIKFSHATHAGIQKIDCQYCHDGARRSKHSVIPATNTCMNCHTAIKVGSKYGTAELTKIYASAGWDPNSGFYFEDNISKEQKIKAFRQWVTENVQKENEGIKDARLAKLVNEQMAAITPQVDQPIEWVKIHNLADHVYFNHAQHVTVGKLECQDCHGKVEEMEVVHQHAPLSMGWCINCHRETQVQFADNPYYDSYEQYHKQLKNPKSGRTGVTVEEIGGLECQKCHY